MRCFVAFSIPKNVKDSLLKVQDELKLANPDIKVAWTKPEQWHITMQFLGEIDVALVPQIKQTVNQIIPKYRSFRFYLDGIDIFPNKFNPRIIVIKVKDETGEAIKFQKELFNKLKNLDLELDDKPWSPHITLGRVKSLGSKLELSAVVEKVECNVDVVELVESKLATSGPIYTVLENYSLRK